MNNPNRIRQVVCVLLWVVVVPLLVVGFKYWHWERTLHVDETGHGFSVPLGSSTYAKAMEVVYLPVKAVLEPIKQRLSIGGAAIDFAFDLTSVVLQHVGLLLLWRAWQARRLRNASRPASTHNEAQPVNGGDKHRRSSLGRFYIRSAAVASAVSAISGNTKMQRVPLSAAVPALCFLFAVGATVHPPERWPYFLSYLGAGILLASPFLVLLVGHFRLAASWKSRVYLIVGAALFLYAWYFATFLLGWFQGGWYWAAALGALLSVCAVLYVLPLLFIGRSARRVG